MVKAGTAAMALPLTSRVSLAAGNNLKPSKSAAPLVLESPGKTVEAAFFMADGGRLGYRMSLRGRVVIEDSPLGIMIDGKDLGLVSGLPGSIERKTIDRKYPWSGAHSVAIDRCIEARIPLRSASGVEWALEVRAYDDGLAFRYSLPSQQGPMTVTGESGAFVIPAGSTAWFQDNTRNYEGIHHAERIEDVSGLAPLPVTVVLPEEAGFLAITEAALFGYSGMTLQADKPRELGSVFLDDESWQADAPAKSPWRVIMASKTLDGLVNSDMVHNLCPDPSEEIFGNAGEWIRPGRALWSWWSEGTGTPELQRKYVDGASELGFEYILVDEGWEFWFRLGKNKWDIVAELVDYARARGVSVWLWKRWKKLSRPAYREKFFKKAREIGVVGIKIDFMDSESRDRVEFYEAALRDAGRHRLMVNFHGANKPTGESRTYPNEMTREGIRGLEYNRFGAALTPEYNVTIPFTRLLAGHADYTPVTFNPAKTGATTFAHQLAMPIVVLSQVTNYADRPENFLQNPATEPALPLLKSIPTVWDRTVVLDASEIGRCAAFARRSGKTWFVGVMNASSQRDVSIELSFLDKGKHEALILTDPPDGSLGFKSETRTVDRKSAIKTTLIGGGGLTAMIKPGD